MTTAEIITIGTELLLGETANTNTRFLARILCGLGMDLYRTLTVGDNAGLWIPMRTLGRCGGRAPARGCT
jgi:molybdopterin-biosynthesis enzyme MoeA-like protein